jgi:hypothetical protein
MTVYIFHINQNMVSNPNIDLDQTSSRLPGSMTDTLPGSMTEKVNFVSAHIIIALDEYVLPIV